MAGLRESVHETEQTVMRYPVRCIYTMHRTFLVILYKKSLPVFV